MRKPSDSNSDTSVRAERPSTPRWVKVFGIILLVLLLLVFIMKFVIGGNHGPSRHISISNAIEQGVKQPL
ncbi:hypothetical protein [Alkalihalobacillus sp. AL-G]|uniref:hypothetical protein n=1 Tax=Alkalihalobacillus sp. AL-G TaxID=2926399 RepID=UPI00272CAEB6|nr:hypothetical protein [Alkalihalobacillus sp. AL-G]WLD92032.1 hypothetical protein MOJ78_13440 [Alkalihalobacillus sp. AL-G]